jgi:hypothetical protein
MIAQVHRFRDKVAVYVGHGETTYLDLKTARKLARAINAAARDIAQQPRFSESKCGTVTIEAEVIVR